MGVKKYVTGRAVGPLVQVTTVDRETEKFVYVGGCRLAKSSGFESFHDDFATARAAVLLEIDERLGAARRQLRDASYDYREIVEMRDPAETVQ